MNRLYEHIDNNEPVSRSEIRAEFGRDGVKRLAGLLDDSRVFEGESGEFWSVGGAPEDDSSPGSYLPDNSIPVEPEDDEP